MHLVTYLCNIKEVKELKIEIYAQSFCVNGCQRKHVLTTNENPFIHKENSKLERNYELSNENLSMRNI